MRKALYYFFPVVLWSCAKDSAPLQYGDFPTEIGYIIGRSCSVEGCHNAKSYEAASGLNLESWSSLFRGSRSGSPVIPYSSRLSSLCYFINDYDDLGPKNTPRMPLNQKALEKTEVQAIQTWINQGAPDQNGKVMWADNPYRKKLYAVNQACDVVTVFDSESKLPMRYIDVGTKSGSIDTPHQIRVSPDGQFWYVVFINNNVMQKFRCSDDSYVGSIPLSPFAAGQSANPDDDALDWNTFVISKDSKRAYCVSWTANGKVAAVDLVNMKLLHYAPGFPFAHGIALNAAEDKMYITAQSGNFITELDTGFNAANNFSLQNGMAPSSNPSLDLHDILLSPSGSSFYITCQRSNEVRVFDLGTKSVTAVIATGIYPQEIVYSATSGEFYVSCTNDTISFAGAHGVITSIQAQTHATKKLKCGFQPHGIACDETKKLLYVLSRNILSNGIPPHHSSVCQGRNGYVNFVDLRTFSLLPEKYELSVDPYFVNPRP